MQIIRVKPSADMQAAQRLQLDLILETATHILGFQPTLDIIINSNRKDLVEIKEEGLGG